MYEILKAFAIAQGWVFDYGRSDFQNLFEAVEQKNKSHLFLDPVEIRKIRNDTGGVEAFGYSGNFMILYSSDIDEISYQDRYDKYIKPILSGQLDALENELICNQEA
ncbi:MAG: hypothetical protein KAR20_14255, partial [Candidatus Heimdallarchaeota archaeon]|nr:hypothetical protein [Candidatus Heimdallarchaeota archaeon]